jgi:Icc-related predicted phosphoesterase
VVIQTLSDIHTDLHADCGKTFLSYLDSRGVDVLVIAGDFCSWLTDYHSRQVFEILSPKYPRILYVPGNHEYWEAGDVHEMPARFRKLEKEFPNVTVLDNHYTEIAGYRFLGGTMWYGEPPPPLIAMKLKWSDYKHTENFEPWVYQQNAGFVQMVRNYARQGDIVISHHLPSYQSVHPRYTNDWSNHFYVTDMEEEIRALRPALWIHGHTHNAWDYKIEGTRVVCNPMGYPHERTSRREFQERLLITL